MERWIYAEIKMSTKLRNDSYYPVMLTFKWFEPPIFDWPVEELPEIRIYLDRDDIKKAIEAMEKAMAGEDINKGWPLYGQTWMDIVSCCNHFPVILKFKFFERPTYGWPLDDLPKIEFSLNRETTKELIEEMERALAETAAVVEKE